MMIPICYQLGLAAAKAGGVPDTDHIEDPQWQHAYMRGYEKGKRQEAARKAKEGSNGKRS